MAAMGVFLVGKTLLERKRKRNKLMVSRRKRVLIERNK
jgi:hypothetical protein